MVGGGESAPYRCVLASLGPTPLTSEIGVHARELLALPRLNLFQLDAAPHLGEVPPAVLDHRLEPRIVSNRVHHGVEFRKER